MRKLLEHNAAAVSELKRILYQRPLVLPAVTVFLTCLACYRAASFVPALITAAGTLLFGIVTARKDLRLLLCYFITASMLIFSGWRIAARLNAFSSFEGFGDYRVTVTDISTDLDGTSLYECSLENGAHIAVYADSDPDIGTGDTLLISGKLSKPEGPGNPGEFDFAEHLRRQGILYVMWPDSMEVVSKGGMPGSWKGLAGYQMYLLKERMLDSFSGGDEGIKALSAAVFTGDTSLLDDETVRGFRLSNCSHLLAVSGTHFAGFLLIIPYVLRAFRVKRRQGVVFYAAAALAIGMFTGWSDSVTRACVMSTCSFASRDGPSAMCLAALIMMAADPFAALGTGFQLSFAAAGAILLFLPAVTDKLMRIGLSETFAGMIAPALTVTAAMMPFCGTTGLRLHPMVLAVQIAASFVVQAACMFLIPGFVLGINTPAAFCLRLLGMITSFGAACVSSAGIPSAEPGGVILACSLLLCLLLLPSCFVRKHFTGPVCLILALSVGFRTSEVLNRPLAEVIFADVGQGDCCLIITDDKTCLIDAGVYEEGEDTVRDILDHYGIASVDLAFMSHWDTDHAGGIAALYGQGRIKQVCTGFTGDDKDVRDFLASLPFDESMEDAFLEGCAEVSAGDVFELSEGVELKVLAPAEASGGGNEDSLVMTLEAGGETVLFTGDIGKETEEQLIQEGVLTDCGILKVAHHGSKYSTSEAFLEEVTPEIAVISVGRNNFYGHPTEECLGRLEDAGCSVLRTDTDGAVIIELG